ncbi:MAG: hypothetical protein J5764_06210 [Bacteroidales bacterium]|nr:hypothetical protein [Bacteroidales bacterium]
MKKLFITLTVVLVACFVASAQKDTTALAKYRRSSLYTVLIKHSSYPYAAEILTAFKEMPIPDKFNDHNLWIREFESNASKMKQHGKTKDNLNIQDADQFIADNGIAKALVAKWFNRDPSTGGFDINLIQERGFYDASQLDIASAKESARGTAALGDAGEELIGKTFVMVNDITFVDKGETSAKVATGITIAGRLAGALLGSSAISSAGNLAAAATNEIDGFTVNITSYLYRLIWDDVSAATFYSSYWFPANTTDPTRRAAFNNSDIFRVEYVGSTSTSASNVSSKSFAKQTKGQQMLKVCTRAIDKSIVQLQRAYDEFKVNVPLYKIAEDGSTVDVQIGLKEGVNEKSRYEVLMPVELATGGMKYERVGMIQPVKGKIWDNRFGALEEAIALKQSGEKSKDKDAANLEAASLNATTFKVLTGANKIVPGCLVREVTIKRQ